MEDWNKKVSDLLSTLYDICPEGIVPIDSGDWNMIFGIQDRSEWILRLSHPRKRRQQLEFELDLLRYLKPRLGFVPDVKPTVDGGLYGEYRDRFCVLFSRIPGSEITQEAVAAEATGRALGLIHNEVLPYSTDHQLIDDMSLIDFDWKSNYFYTGDLFDAGWFQSDAWRSVRSSSDIEFLSEIRASLPFLVRTRQVLSRWLCDRRDAGTFTEAIIHGDYYQRNILWDGNDITGVIDWDETNTSWLEYELANAVWEFSYREEAGMIDESTARVLVDAYMQVRDTPEPSRESLLRLIGVRRLIEIQHDLYEFRIGGDHDFEYCVRNINGLRELGI